MIEPSAVPRLAVPPAPSSFPERRAWVRYYCLPPGLDRVFVSAGGQRDPASVQNISRGGIGLLLGRRVEPGTAVRVELGNASATLLDARARVAHVTQEPAGDWLIGCAFDAPLSQEELDKLLG
jgi:hypothetical protein